MIARTTAGVVPLWQRRLGEAVGSVGELLDLLGLDPEMVDADDGVRDFPLRVPRSFVARMRPGDPRDPLLAQVLPVAAERREAPGFTTDPLAEAAAPSGGIGGESAAPSGIGGGSSVSPAPGLLHKYRGRALLVVTGACGVHCRYCFRRHFPYAEHRDRDAREALAWIAAEPSIEEVILSGGDPLSLSDERLAALAEAIAAIPHVRRLRLHTRMPIVLPERVDGALTAWLTASPLRKVVVVHANHPQEIDGEVAGALRRLGATGATLLNQAVLLAGVNDSAATQRELGETLFAAGVLPYYLHLLDRVAGADRFEVDEAAARRLVAELTASTAGYLVPRLVREVPGAPAKVPVDLRLGLHPGA